jgi:hypothetical protein
MSSPVLPGFAGDTGGINSLQMGQNFFLQAMDLPQSALKIA